MSDGQAEDRELTPFMTSLAAVIDHPPNQPVLTRLATFPRLRALTWAGRTLYASRGYELLQFAADTESPRDKEISWKSVASFRPAQWRQVTASNRLTSRLCRDGFHALAVHPSGALVAAVPGAILTAWPGEDRFHVSHHISRGTRPLHIVVIPGGTIYWGEYFDNADRDEVHIYASADGGATWHVAYTIPKGSIRHVHNMVYDPTGDCLWVLTGDYGQECRILRASCDFAHVEAVLQGNQQARAAAILPTKDGLYFSSDSPLELNHIYHLDHGGKLSQLARITSSSIYGCAVGEWLFLSTMVEPSSVNPDPQVRIYGSRGGREWHPLLAWKKDLWPMGLFQYGNAFLPDGINPTKYLAVTTIAVESCDQSLSLYEVGDGTRSVI